MSLGNVCRSDEVCQHDEDFTFRPFKNQIPIGGAWFCSLSCGYHLNFDPSWAGTVRPKVNPHTTNHDYWALHWSHSVLGYIAFPNPSATKTWKASPGGKY